MIISTLRNIIGYGAMISIVILLISALFIDGVDLMQPAPYAADINPVTGDLS